MIEFKNEAYLNHLYISDVIGDDININSFKEELDNLVEGDLIIHMNSVGGSVFEGWAIANAIREESKKKKRKIKCKIEGICASIATAIAIACDEVEMYKNSLMMIHRASVMCYGNVDDLFKQIEILEKIDNQLAEAYANKSKGKHSKEEFLELMSKESWFNADECLELGLVDAIADEQIQLVACANVKDLHYKDISKLENLIQQVEEKEQQNKIENELKELENWLSDF